MAFSLLQKIAAFKANVTHEFYSHVGDLLEEKMVQDLDNHIQHYCYSRLQHSLDVAYYSFVAAKLLGWDARSTARGGLLHDLYFYDWHVEDFEKGNHASNHPVIACENAKTICDLNALEEDIIVKHMWLCTLRPPSYKEGYIVTFVDKYCATKEFLISLFTKNSAVRAVNVTRG